MRNFRILVISILIFEKHVWRQLVDIQHSVCMNELLVKPGKRHLNSQIHFFGEMRLFTTDSHEMELLYHKNKWNDEKYYHDHDDSRMVGSLYGRLSRYVEHKKEMLVCKRKMIWKPC